MEQVEILGEVAKSLGITINDNLSLARQVLIDRINELLQHDFNKLVSILYRVDVSDQKLQSLLQQHSGQDAAGIIADLLIERQIQKIKSRKEFRHRDDTISEDDKW